MEFVYWRILGTIDWYYGWMDVADVKKRENEVYCWLNHRRFYHSREIGDKYRYRWNDVLETHAHP